MATGSHSYQPFPRPKSEPPSLDAIREKIPKSLFVKSTPYSIYFLVKDLVILSILYYTMLNYSTFFDTYFFLYPIWWFAIGTYFWALFVVGHDCGHRSFSDSVVVCDVFGTLSHSLILVPFHPWRLSHAKHHRNTAHVENDESFIAVPEDYYVTMTSMGLFFRFYAYWLGGYVLYLIGGMPVTFHSHMIPLGHIYPTTKNKIESTVSILCVLGMVYFLSRLYVWHGLWFLTKVYLVPFLVFNAWIATVTHMHHTHPDVPWYSGEKEWTFVKGALSTVDRNYGFIEDIHHNIGTHVVHHLFSHIPHYNIVEATKHIRPILGEYHRACHDSVFTAMSTAFNYCRFVPSQPGKLYYVENWQARLETLQTQPDARASSDAATQSANKKQR